MLESVHEKGHIRHWTLACELGDERDCGSLTISFSINAKREKSVLRGISYPTSAYHVGEDGGLRNFLSVRAGTCLARRNRGK